jgi:hypothetical protein
MILYQSVERYQRNAAGIVGLTCIHRPAKQARIDYSLVFAPKYARITTGDIPESRAAARS